MAKKVAVSAKNGNADSPSSTSAFLDILKNSKKEATVSQEEAIATDATKVRSFINEDVTAYITTDALSGVAFTSEKEGDSEIVTVELRNTKCVSSHVPTDQLDEKLTEICSHLLLAGYSVSTRNGAVKTNARLLKPVIDLSRPTKGHSSLSIYETTGSFQNIKFSEVMVIGSSDNVPRIFIKKEPIDLIVE